MKPPNFITVVSGLPRSGTSMMMQALEAGGISPLTDDQRTADEDNPRGYYELERVKRIRNDDSFLDKAEGKAVKLIHLLITRLPARHNFRVLFMQRDIDEVLASQSKMLERSGNKGASVAPDALKKIFTKQLAETITWLQQQPNIQLLEVDYKGMIDEPAGTIAGIDEFLGGEMNVEAMAAAIDPSLYRNRQS